MSNPPAGWYPDPTGQPNTIRFWNGEKWTNQTEHEDPESTQDHSEPTHQAASTSQAPPTPAPAEPTREPVTAETREPVAAERSSSTTPASAGGQSGRGLRSVQESPGEPTEDGGWWQPTPTPQMWDLEPAGEGPRLRAVSHDEAAEETVQEAGPSPAERAQATWGAPEIAAAPPEHWTQREVTEQELEAEQHTPAPEVPPTHSEQQPNGWTLKLAPAPADDSESTENESTEATSTEAQTAEAASHGTDSAAAESHETESHETGLAEAESHGAESAEADSAEAEVESTEAWSDVSWTEQPRFAPTPKEDAQPSGVTQVPAVGVPAADFGVQGADAPAADLGVQGADAPAADFGVQDADVQAADAAEVAAQLQPDWGSQAGDEQEQQSTDQPAWGVEASDDEDPQTPDHPATPLWTSPDADATQEQPAIVQLWGDQPPQTWNGQQAEQQQAWGSGSESQPAANGWDAGADHGAQQPAPWGDNGQQTADQSWAGQTWPVQQPSEQSDNGWTNNQQPWGNPQQNTDNTTQPWPNGQQPTNPWDGAPQTSSPWGDGQQANGASQAGEQQAGGAPWAANQQAGSGAWTAEQQNGSGAWSPDQQASGTPTSAERQAGGTPWAPDQQGAGSSSAGQQGEQQAWGASLGDQQWGAGQQGEQQPWGAEQQGDQQWGAGQQGEQEAWGAGQQGDQQQWGGGQQGESQAWGGQQGDGQQGVGVQHGTGAQQQGVGVQQGGQQGWGEQTQRAWGEDEDQAWGGQADLSSGVGKKEKGKKAKGSGGGRSGAKLPLIVGGGIALVMLIVAAVFLITSPGDDKKADPTPTGSTQPTGSPTSQSSTKPGQSKNPKLHEGTGRISSDAISFPRRNPPWSDRKRLVQQLLDSSGQHIVLQENVNGADDWTADIFVGGLGTGSGFNGDPKATAAALSVQLRTSMYGSIPATYRTVANGAVKRTDKSGWFFQQTVTAKSAAVTDRVLTLTVAVFDLGDGTAVAYISGIPNNRPDLKAAESQAFKGINVG